MSMPEPSALSGQSEAAFTSSRETDITSSPHRDIAIKDNLIENQNSLHCKETVEVEFCGTEKDGSLVASSSVARTEEACGNEGKIAKIQAYSIGLNQYFAMNDGNQAQFGVKNAMEIVDGAVTQPVVADAGTGARKVEASGAHHSSSKDNGTPQAQYNMSMGLGGEDDKVLNVDTPSDKAGDSGEDSSTPTGGESIKPKKFGILGRKWSRRSSHQAGEEEKKEEEYPPVSFFKLYSYADKFDMFAQVVGIIGALGNGVIFPVFTIIFGDILDDIAINYYVFRNTEALTESVSATVPKFMYLGVGGMVAAFLQVFFLIYSSIRQTNRIRETYLKTVLQQDIGYFDTFGTSGALLQGLNEDCMKVQAAIGEKVSMFLFMSSTAISGIAIGMLLYLLVLQSFS